MNSQASRRSFLQNVGLGSLGTMAAGGMLAQLQAAEPDAKIFGAEGVKTTERPKGKWEPISDRKIRVGIVGYGVCQWGAAFGFQNHPNVTIAAVSDLFPDRCSGLAKACRCEKTYPSLEELVKDDTIEAVFVATDAPSHSRHCLEVLKHGKHVATAVPALFGSLEDADKLIEAVGTSGRNYMMFETTAFHDDCTAMRNLYRAEGFGKLIYTEGEYFHYGDPRIDSYQGWRDGLPPQWYPTHSNAYYSCVTGGSFTEVSCLGIPSILPIFQATGNRYKNPFGTEIALMRTSEGGMARMAVSWDSKGPMAEAGRVRGQRGAIWDSPYQGDLKQLPDLSRPPLPPGVEPGGHGGSHGHLMEEFVSSILENRQPLVNLALSLNMTAAGIVAHQSALKDGETMKIPQYQMPKA